MVSCGIGHELLCHGVTREAIIIMTLKVHVKYFPKLVSVVLNSFYSTDACSGVNN